MKTLLFITILGSTITISYAQLDRPAMDLNQDPVFRNVAEHRIQYPVQPVRRAIYGRYYAGFTIDTAGHIQAISVLYPRMSKQVSKLYGFDEAIRSGLKRMPPLNPAEAGSYVLPVAFCYTHYAEGANPIVPTNMLPQGYDVGNRVLLDEVRIYASSPSEQRALNFMPHSRQIGQ